MWVLTCYAAYCLVQVIKRQFELMDKSGKNWKVNVQDVKTTYPLDELKKKPFT